MMEKEMNNNYFENINEIFSKLPYEFNVTQLHFYMNGNIPKLDNCGDYDVRLKKTSSSVNEKKYDVIKTIGPYDLNLKSFNKISIRYDKEENEYFGKLWIPTKIYNNLNKENKLCLLENFILKRNEKIKEDLSNLKNLINDYGFER